MRSSELACYRGWRIGQALLRVGITSDVAVLAFLFRGDETSDYSVTPLDTTAGTILWHNRDTATLELDTAERVFHHAREGDPADATSVLERGIRIADGLGVSGIPAQRGLPAASFAPSDRRHASAMITRRSCLGFARGPSGHSVDGEPHQIAVVPGRDRDGAGARKGLFHARILLRA
jgi:hypothetical protein